MNTKVLPVRTPEKLEWLDHYFQDQDSPRHLHQLIGPRELFGYLKECLSVILHYYAIAEEVAFRNKAVRRGPKREILGYHVMVRAAPVSTPAMALTQVEYDLVPQLLYDMLERDMISQVHLHPSSDVDWHFLIVGEWPRHPSAGATIRRCVDQIHDAINARRLKEGRPLLPGVTDRRLEKLTLRGFDPLAIQLALRGASTIEQLPATLADLGHRVGPGGIDKTANKIHVIHCQSPDMRSYPYNLHRLLDDVAKAIEYLGSSGTPMAGTSISPAVEEDHEMGR